MDIERGKPGTAADKTITSQSIPLRLNGLYEINKQSSVRASSMQESLKSTDYTFNTMSATNSYRA